MKLQRLWSGGAEPDVDPEFVAPSRGGWRRFLTLLWRAKLPFLLIAALFVVSKYAVDIGLDQTKYIAEIIAGNVSTDVVRLLVIAILVGWALGAASGLLNGIIVQVINRNLRRLVWRRVVNLPASYFQKSPAREAVSRVTTDTEDVGQFLMVTVYPLLISGYMTYAVIGRVSHYDARLGLAIGAFVPILLILSWTLGRFKYVANRDVTVRNAGLTQRLAEYVSNIPLIKSFAVTPRERQRGDMMIHDLYRARIRTGLVDCVSTVLHSSVGLIQTVVLIAAGVALLDSGAISRQEWVAFFLYAANITANLSGVTGAWESAKAVQGTTARIAELVDAEPETGGATPMPYGGSDIVLTDVSYRYDEDLVLSGINHTFPAGRLSVVVGPSGSGKSTLLRLLQRVYPASEGVIQVHGTPIQDFDLAGYRAAFGSVGQDGPLVAGTVSENLLLGVDREVTDEELVAGLCFRGDRDFLANLPDGLSTEVGDYGSKLSGGQRHRIGLARALLRQAPFILLDEPTAALDTGATSAALEEIRSATQGRTTILVAHTPAAVTIADEVLVLEDGRITATGTPAEVAQVSAYVREAMPQ